MISKSKSILRKSSLNGTIMSFLKKSKARTFFSKSPDNFFKSQSQNRKIGVRIPSIVIKQLVNLKRDVNF